MAGSLLTNSEKNKSSIENDLKENNQIFGQFLEKAQTKLQDKKIWKLMHLRKILFFNVG
jgi:hypothetical protein